MESKINIVESLRKIDINPNDLVMIHGNAGIAGQLSIRNSKSINLVQELIRQIHCSFSANGTIVVPSFTYSATRNESYDKNSTKSEVGLFSEEFRKYPGTIRSNHPIFSVSALGKYAIKFKDSQIYDCFGEGSSFDLLYQLNGKIVFLGCSFNAATFTHYVEQKMSVPYRFLKKFKIINKDNKNETVSYYARSVLSEDSEIDLNRLKRIAIEKNFLQVSEFGRFNFMSIKAKDFFHLAKNMIEVNEYALTKKGSK